MMADKKKPTGDYEVGYLRVGHKRRPPVRYKREVVIAYRDARETDPEEKL